MPDDARRRRRLQTTEVHAFTVSCPDSALRTVEDRRGQERTGKDFQAGTNQVHGLARKRDKETTAQLAGALRRGSAPLGQVAGLSARSCWETARQTSGLMRSGTASTSCAAAIASSPSSSDRPRSEPAGGHRFSLREEGVLTVRCLGPVRAVPATAPFPKEGLSRNHGSLPWQAALGGSTREAPLRSLSQFAERGAVGLKNGEIRVLDASVLRRLADGWAAEAALRLRAGLPARDLRHAKHRPPSRTLGSLRSTLPRRVY